MSRALIHCLVMVQKGQQEAFRAAVALAGRSEHSRIKYVICSRVGEFLGDGHGSTYLQLRWDMQIGTS